MLKLNLHFPGVLAAISRSVGPFLYRDESFGPVDQLRVFG
jgi:hypothetical protein